MASENKKNATIYYGLIMAVYSIGYVTLSAFSSLYLLDIGLSNGAVGALLAIASLVSVLLQPGVGSVIDKNPKVSTKQMLLLMAMLIAILGILLLFIPGKNMILSTILYGVSVMLLMLGQPFLNALGMDAINYGYPINFGIGRGMGSLGYAFGSAAFGRVSVMFGARSVPVAFSIAFCILCFLIYIYPVKQDGKIYIENNHAVNVEKKENPFLFLLKYKRMGVMLVGLMLIYFSHILINTFSLQIVVSKNGTSSDMGTAAAIAAICELITTLLFPVYLKYFKLHKMLRVAGIFFALKTFLSYLVPNVFAFYLIQSTQMFGWGIMSIGIVYYVNNLVGEHDKARGQAFAGMSYTLSSVLGTLIGGNIIDYLGVNAMLLVGTLLAVLGTVIVWITVEETTDKSKAKMEEYGDKDINEN